MRRLFGCLLALLLAVGLTACQPAQQTEPETELPGGTQTEEPQEPTEPEPPAVEEPEPEPEEPERLDYAPLAVEGVEGLYDLSRLEQLSGLQVRSAALAGEDTLILLAGEQGDSVWSFDLTTGALLRLFSFEMEEEADYWATSLLSTDPLLVADYHNGRILYWDSEEEMVCTLADASIDYTAVTVLDGAWYYYSYDTQTICRRPLSGGTVTELAKLPPEYVELYSYGFTMDGTCAIFQGTEVWGGGGVSIFQRLSDGGIAAVYRDAFITREQTSPVRITASLEEGSGSVYQLTAAGPDGTAGQSLDLALLLRPTDTQTAQECWLSATVPSDIWGRTVLMLEVGEMLRPILWDYSAMTLAETEQEPWEAFTPPERIDYGALSVRAAELEETYGVRIYLGENAVVTFPDYTTSACTDEQMMSDALDTLEEALSLYPPSYLEQLCHEANRAICLYLTGTLTPIYPDQNIDNPGGIACPRGDVQMIAFNLEYLRVQDVVHELNHVLDSFLWASDALDEETWNAMNPEGFDYYYSYIDENGESYEWTGDTTYTTWSSSYYLGDLENAYFIDPYSTTYPTEDRARLMEYLLAGYYAGAGEFFSGEHAQEKLSYYFDCIRRSFDTAGWPEQTAWEAALAGAADGAAADEAA